MRLGRAVSSALLTSLVAGCASTAILPPAPLNYARYEASAGKVVAPEHFYLLVFASQSTPKLPRYTHTWATVVRVRDCGPHRPPEIEYDTISWLPASHRIHTWDLWVEEGVNLDLRRTLEVIRAQQQRVSLWGPYEIEPDLYRHFLAQKAFLESGRVGYQALDDLGEAGMIGNGMNCIHAVADCDERFGCPLWCCGEATGEYFARHLVEEGAVINPDQSHVWLIPALCLNDCAIIRHGPP
jgi:hypothetical protein